MEIISQQDPEKVRQAAAQVVEDMENAETEAEVEKKTQE